MEPLPFDEIWSIGPEGLTLIAPGRPATVLPCSRRSDGCLYVAEELVPTVWLELGFAPNPDDTAGKGFISVKHSENLRLNNRCVTVVYPALGQARVESIRIEYEKWRLSPDV